MHWRAFGQDGTFPYLHKPSAEIQISSSRWRTILFRRDSSSDFDGTSVQSYCSDKIEMLKLEAVTS